MTTTIILLLVAVFLHVILCAVLLILQAFKILYLRSSIYPIVFLVIIFGPLCGFLIGRYSKKKTESAAIGVDDFNLESDVFRSSSLKGEETEAVSLEDALSLNESTVRRKLMLDILNSDSSGYYSLLKKASMNDDVEVVHYATTAMAELNKQYDTKLSDYSRKYKQNPEDLENLQMYCDCLKRYLDLGFVKGQMEKSRRTEAIGLMRQLVTASPTIEHYSVLVHLELDNQLFKEAAADIGEMKTHWFDKGPTWIAMLDYAIATQDGDKLHRVLSEAKSEHIYFTPEEQDKVRFWEEK